MKIKLLTLSVLVSLGTGFSAVPHVALAASPALPNCFDSNYDRAMGLFTVKNLAPKQINQQCLLTVGSRGGTASSSGLAAGRYEISLSAGGGGGAGGTLQGASRGANAATATGGSLNAAKVDGGGGGGGAGAKEERAVINLTEGAYKLTIGAGGPGGTACMLSPSKFDGGPGWLGYPSNIVRVPTGEVVMGTPGADTFKALTRAQNDRAASKSATTGKRQVADGRGGSGPGQTTGGSGGSENAKGVEINATAGASAIASRGEATRGGGAAGTDTDDKSRSGGGGGGGGSKVASGGSGGGEITTATVSRTGKAGSSQPVEIQPNRGNLGSGGGGGEGSSVKCEPGAPGGNGFIAFKPL